MIIVYYLSLSLFLFLCFLLCAVILIQESKSMGLGSSFSADSDAVFGASTPNVLKKFTAVLVGLFLASCVLLSLWTSALGRYKTKAPPLTVQEELQI